MSTIIGAAQQQTRQVADTPTFNTADLVFRVDTGIVADSASGSFTLPIETPAGDVSYTWEQVGGGEQGNGTITNGTTSASYDVVATGTAGLVVDVHVQPTNLVDFSFNLANDAEKVLGIWNFGDASWGAWSGYRIEGMWYGCRNMEFINATDAPNLTNVLSLKNAFYYCGELKDSFIADFNSWNTSAILNIEYTFARDDVSAGKGIDPIVTDWDVTSVTSARQFLYNSSATSNLTSWVLSSTTSIRGILWGAPNTTADTTNWGISSACTTVYAAFYNHTNLNPNISTWDMSGVIDGAIFLSGTSFSDANYNSALAAFAADVNILSSPMGISFGPATPDSQGVTDRTYLVNNKQWTITDGTGTYAP